MKPKLPMIARPAIAIAVALTLGACGDDDGTAPPTTGTLEVTVLTTGDAPDPDGYTLTVGSVTRDVGINGGEIFSDLPEGGQTVELGDIAADCTVTGENPRTVVVTAGETASTTFDVTCAPTALEVTAVTTGDAPDPDGYTVLVGSSDEPVEVNGTVRYEVDGGPHTVELRDVAYNCVVSGDNPRDVDVAWGATATTTFEVDCPTPLAVLDGVRSPGEWDGATSVPAFDGATVLYMNDGVNLYLAFEVEDETLGADDNVRFRFDNQRDGAWDEGEDNFSLSGAGNFTDLHASATGWSIFDDQQDGAGAAGASAGVNFFEIAHPLDSGDPQDFALSPGDTVGYCVIYRMDGVGVSATTFPIACHMSGDDLSGYAELEVSAAPAPHGSP